MVIDEALASTLLPFAEAMIAPSAALIFDSFERADGIYIVISGEVDVSLSNERGAEVWSSTVGAGSILGLPAAVGHTHHSLRAVAWSKASLGFLSTERLKMLIRDNPVVGTGVLRCLSEEVRGVWRKVATLGLKYRSGYLD